MKPLKHLLLAAVWMLLALSAGATTFYVNVSNTVPLAPYTSWPTAATNIQNAIDVSNDGDLVLVTNGVYATGGRVVYGSPTNRVVVNKAIRVQSVNGPGVTVIQGNRPTGDNAVRCVYLANMSVLDGFTITNGATLFYLYGSTNDFNGGGIWCESTSALILNCLVISNQCSGSSFVGGGGVFSGTLSNCTIVRNLGASGAGVYNSVVRNCSLVGNDTANGDQGDGGGAYNSTLNSCLLVSNYCGGYGGGAFNCILTNCSLNTNTANRWGGASYLGQLNNCILIGNSGNMGGGAASARLNNCMLSGNFGLVGGGGAYACMLGGCTIGNNSTSGDISAGLGGGVHSCTNYNCVIISNTAVAGGGAYQGRLINCTLAYNSALYYGGGVNQSMLTNCTVVFNSTLSNIGKGGGVYGIDRTTVNNCVIYNNLAATGSNYYAVIVCNYCCSSPLPPNGIGNIINVPMFMNLASGDFHIQSNSPCINAGNNSYITNLTDLDGNPRIRGGTVDIGAYEYQSPSSILSYAWAQQYGLPTDGSADFIDSDGDGMNNWQEWIAGIIPTNAASVLLLNPPTNAVTGLQVSWPSVNTRTYYLQRSTNLPAFTAIQSNLVGGAVTTTFTDSSATNGGPYFYRVGVQ